MEKNFSKQQIIRYSTCTLKNHFLIFFLLFASLVHSQSVLIKKSTLNISSLSGEQSINMNKIESQGIFSNYTLIEIDTEALLDPNGIIKTNLDNFFDQMLFKSSRVDYTDPGNFAWYGKFFANDEQSEASLSLISHDGIFAGTMQSDQKSFQIYDLGGGLQVLAEYADMVYDFKRCGAEDSEQMDDITVPSITCGSTVTKVLVIYTQQGYASELNPISKVYLSIADLHNHWFNSDINNSVQVAGIEVLNHLIENDMYQDRFTWSSDPVVQNLRNQYNADIVIFMTKPYNIPNSPLGIVKKVDGSFDDAYAIVAANFATTGNHIFVHEVNHLYGGRHQTDYSSPTYARPYDFKTGDVLGIGGTWRYTNLFVRKTSGPNIEYVSNPDVKFLNRRTGKAGTNDNARRIKERMHSIANYYNDLIPYHATISIAGHGLCEQTGTATVDVYCGTPPYSYEWFYSDNGINAVSMMTTNPTISTFVPLPLFSTILGTFNTRVYTVIVTDALGNQTSATKTIYYNCPTKAPFEQNKTVASPSSEKELLIYPNPNHGNFEISITVPQDDNLEIVLTNTLGETISNVYKGTVTKGTKKIKVERTSSILPGIYYLKIKGLKNTMTEKIIIN